MSLRSSLVRVLARPRSWLRAVTERSRLESEMETELTDHVARLTSDLIRTGVAPADAARRARIALGPALAHKEEMRASLGLRWSDSLGADLRYGTRMLRKSPGFTAIATLSLALAIGANATIFSAARQILYERLAVPHAAELRLLAWTGTEDHVAVHHTHGDYDHLPGGRVTSPVFSYPAYTQLRAQNRGQNGVLGDLLAFRETGVSVTVGENALHLLAEMVSGNYYTVLGVSPQLGRAIDAADDTQGAALVAVISDGLWAREFGRSPAVIGQTIQFNGKPVTIVGVNPRGFTGAKSVQESADLMVPLSAQPILTPANDGSNWLSNPNQWWVNVMGRVKPGVSDRQAQAALDTELNAIVRATMPVRAGEDVPHLVVRDGSRGLFEQEQLFAEPMAVLMTLVGFVLLLACANIANLMLARATRRQREMSVRLALGAGRMRVVMQMLVESLLLAAIGGACGLGMGYLARRAIPQLTERGWARTPIPVHFDWTVFAFTAAVTMLTAILFGVAPAWAAATAELTHGLKDASQTTTRRRKGLGGRALVVVQIALSTLLVIGAGLFLRTLSRLNAVDVGFRTDHLLLVEVSPPQAKYANAKAVALFRRLEESFAALPGVEAVAPAEVAYLSDNMSATDFLTEGEAYDMTKKQGEVYNVVGNSFFQTMGIPIVQGRAFGAQDTANSVKVGIINQSLARRRFPNQNLIGKRFSISGHDSDNANGEVTRDVILIVGVCGDTRYENLRNEPPPQFFLPYVQQGEPWGMTYGLRTQMKSEALIPELRKAMREIDPDLPLINVRTQVEQIEMDLLEERLFVTLTSGFGLLALALASVGIYGIMAYSVANRTGEIGIRLALGAQPGQVRGMILRESTWLAVVGITAGLGGALLLARAVKSMLYGIAPNDPLTLAGSIALLIGVALAASWIPARRASGVQPVVALRHE